MKKLTVCVLIIFVGISIFANNVVAQSQQSIFLDVTYNGEDWEEFQSDNSDTYGWVHYGLYKKGTGSEGLSRFILQDYFLNTLVESRVDIEDLPVTTGKEPDNYENSGEVDLYFHFLYTAGLVVSSSTNDFLESYVCISNYYILKSP